MTRRTLLLGAGAQAARLQSAPEIAITMDDVAWQAIPEPFEGHPNTALLGALRQKRVKAGLFAAGKNVDNQRGSAILQSWSDDGHVIGNHTYSHRSYSSLSFEDFSADVLKGESIMKPFAGYRGMFRFPVLKEGDTAAKRDGMRTHLEKHGWWWISAADAFQDPVFRSEPKTVPAGESLIWALAKETGRFERELRYPGEDGIYERATVDRI